jgi:hypothetical protein
MGQLPWRLSFGFGTHSSTPGKNGMPCGAIGSALPAGRCGQSEGLDPTLMVRSDDTG